MDVNTGEFHKLLDGTIIPDDHVGPFERGDGILMGNVVCVHEFGLTVRVAQVGAVVEHLGQKFRVMKLENGNAVLRSMASLMNPKTHDPAAVAAQDKQLTDQVMEDAEELLVEPEPLPFDELERKVAEKQERYARTYGGHGEEVITELPDRDEANEELRKALGDRMAPPDAHTAMVGRMNAGAREAMGDPADPRNVPGTPEYMKHQIENGLVTKHEPDELDKQLTEDKQIMDDLCAIEEGLSDWEVTFIEDVTRKVEQGDTLTPAQREKANEILTEKE